MDCDGERARRVRQRDGSERARAMTGETETIDEKR